MALAIWSRYPLEREGTLFLRDPFYTVFPIVEKIKRSEWLLFLMLASVFHGLCCFFMRLPF